MFCDLDARLRRSTPPVDVAACSDAVTEMVDEITSTRRRPVLGSRKRRLAAISAAAFVFVPTVAVAAVHFAAETGQFGTAGATENDRSQYINMCSPDIASYAATLEPRDLALPAGVTWAEIGQQMVAAAQVTCPPRDSGSLMQVTGIKAAYITRSECAWEKDFLAANGAAGTEERQRAGAAIARAEDAISALGVDVDGGTTARRQRAARGDTAWIAYDYQVNCLGRNTAANPPTVAEPR